jgi:antitoxin component YwqK of YwqJK toxin-antitoxin module
MQKRIFIILILSFFFTEIIAQTVSSNQIELKDFENKIYYLKSTGLPFTGIIQDTSEMGNLIGTGKLKDGKFFEYWEYQENEIKGIEWTFLNGQKRNRILYHPTGKVKSELNKNDDGTLNFTREWNINGMLIEETTYKYIKQWFNNGQLKTECIKGSSLKMKTKCVTWDENGNLTNSFEY